MTKKLALLTIVLFFCKSFIYSQTCGGSLGDPIINITFGQGTNPGAELSTAVPGASTSYFYVGPVGVPPSNIVLDGYYAIINGVPSNPGWVSGGDHTGNGNGYMAFFNAAPNPGDFYNQTVTGLCPGTTYEFAAWLLNAINTNVISGAVRPNVTFKIFDPSNLTIPLVSFSTGDIPASNTIIWRRFATLFTTPAGINTVLLVLSNNNVGGTAFVGNDLAIDDITFRACGPLTSASFSATSSITSLSLCNNTQYTLNGTVGSGLNTPSYQWQVSNNNGITWSDIPGANTLNYMAPGSSSGNYLFRLASGENANFTSQFCKFYSNVIDLTVSNITINAGFDTSFCSNNTITYELQGNTMGNGYSWQPSALLNNSTIQNPTAIVTSTTMFYLTASSGSCPAIDSVLVIVNPLPVVSTINDVNICKNDSILLTTAGNADIYQWAPSISVNIPSFSSPYYIDTISQQMIVTGTSSITGCFAKDTVNITVKPIPNIRSIADTTFCGSGTVTLNTTGGQSYSWSPATNLSNPAIANPIFTGSGTQTYIVTGTSSNACTAKDTITITIYAKPLVSTINDIAICRGDSLQLITNSTAQNNQWIPALSVNNPSISNPYFTDTVSQQLIIYGTNSTGCFANDTVNITIKPIPNIRSIADTTFCGSGTVTLNTTGGQSYSWSPATNLSNPAIANPIFTGSGTQTYIVTGTSSNACTAKDTITITIYAKPLVSTINDIAICRGDSLQLITNSTAQNNQWIPALSVNNPSISNPYFTDTVSQQLIIYGTNSTGCFANDTVNITIKPIPNIRSIADTTFCGSGTVTLNTTGGQSYSWSPATNLSNPNISNPVFSSNGSQLYTYYVTGTGANACAARDTVDIQINAIPTVSTIASIVICRGDSLQLISNSNVQNNQWTPALSVNNPNITNPYYTDTVSQIITLTGTNTSTGCFSTASVSVNVKPLPEVKTIEDFLSCATNTVTLVTTGAQAYSWSPSAGLSSTTISNPVFTGTGIHTYYVTGIDANGCIATDTVQVTISNKPVFTSPGNLSVCATESAQLNGNNGPAYQYQWSPSSYLNNNAIVNPIATPPVTSTYTLVITDQVCNYDSSFQVRVTVNPKPIVDITKSNDLDCSKPESQLIASGAVQYNWTPSTGLDNPSTYNPVASPNATTLYIVTGTNSNGCSNKDSIKIYVKGGKYNGFNIPNSFTPNGDNLNDCFGVPDWSETRNFELIIYNKWGQKVFETNSINECWDGNFKGQRSDPGNYVYYLKGETLCGNVIRKGNVLLIR